MTDLMAHQNSGEPWQTVKAQTIVELFYNGCIQEPERPAILVDDGLIVTRRELLERCVQFTTFLRGRVRAGDCVVVTLGDRIELVIAFIGVVANRATLVCVPPTVEEQTFDHILRDCAPVMAIADTKQAALLKRISTHCPSLTDILFLDGTEPNGLSRFAGSSVSYDLPSTASCRDDIVSLNYGLGTIGTPMARMLDHGWWLRALDIDQRLFQRGSQDRQLCCKPIYRLGSLLQLLTSLSTRGSLIAMRNFSTTRFWEVVRHFDATEILSDTSIPEIILKGEPDRRERDHRIRIAFHAGIPKKLHRQLVDRLGFYWIDSYFTPECGLISRVPLHFAAELIGSGTIGVEVPEVDLQIVDNAENEVAGGIVGEALVRTPDMFKGYLGSEDVTRDAMRDGWCRTGDLIRRDERGLLYLMGRKDNI